MSYRDRVLATRPDDLLAYWRLNEASGATVADSTGNGFHGAYNGALWGRPGMGDGGTALGFDGIDDQIDVYSAGLSAAFKGATGSLLVWFKLYDLAATRGLFYAQVNGSNYIFVYITTAGTLGVGYRAAGTTRYALTSALTWDTDWHQYLMTWSKPDDRVRQYLDGQAVGTDASSLGTWAGAPVAMLVGSSSSGVMRGSLAHAALWDVALDAADVSFLFPQWETPITDRTEDDLLARTPKAFWNVADWWRVTGNAEIVHSQIDSLLGVNVPQAALTPPEVGEFPAVSDINDMIGNIEALRVAASLPPAVGITTLKHDYVAGLGAIAPDYQAPNVWERTLELLYDNLPRVGGYLMHCGVASTGQPRFWQSRFRG